jgi:ribosome-associated translation inhibitor RaiA/cold shock CspA family protein
MEASMQVPLEIAFHNFPASDAIEDQIRNRVARLERIYRGLNSCRVRVDCPAKKSNESLPPVVRIEMGIAHASDLVVNHEPRHYQSPDVRNAVNAAFRVAERQLVEFKNQVQRKTKQTRHDEANQFLGVITELADDHGFLRTKEGGSLYFHRNGVLSGDFESLKAGDSVHYVEAVGDTGPIATKVRPRRNGRG